MDDANDSTIAVITSHVRLVRDIGAWRSSILPLAIRQSIALFPMAGIPEPMCERPLTLVKTARHLIERIDDDMRLGRVTFEPGRGWIDRGSFVWTSSNRMSASPRPTTDPARSSVRVVYGIPSSLSTESRGPDMRFVPAMAFVFPRCRYKMRIGC